MDNIISGLIWGGLGVAIIIAFMFIKNYFKALKDPDVKTASLLGMSMSIFRDCQEVFNQRMESFQKGNDTGYSSIRMPKNPNAYKKFEQYKFFVKDINDWWMMSKQERTLMSFNNPYEKPEYKWLLDLKLPNLISNETAEKMWENDERERKEEPNESSFRINGRHFVEDDDLPDCYDIGKPFPLQEYVHIGMESTIPFFNENGFDVVISLLNISEEERKTFISDIVYLSIKNVVGIPFAVLNFNNKFRVDFTLNILKMNKEIIKSWLSNKNKEPEYHITLFLVESNNTNLIAIRRFLFDGMKYLRKICSDQLYSNKDDIDNLIRMNMEYLSIDDIEEKADQRYEDDNGFEL